MRYKLPSFIKRNFPLLLCLISVLFLFSACHQADSDSAENTHENSAFDNIQVKDIDPEHWQSLSEEVFFDELDANIDDLVAPYHNENGMLDAESEEIEISSKTVYLFAQQLAQASVIQGSAYNDTGKTVSFFLNDGTTYVYFPIIENAYSGSEYGVVSIDTLGVIKDVIVTSYTSMGHEEVGSSDAAEAIYKNCPEYTTWNDLNYKETTISNLKQFLGTLNQNNIRAIFWRGHGNVYTADDGTDRVAFIIGEKGSDKTDLKYKEDLLGTTTVGNSPSMIRCKDNLYAINDVFFATYTCNVNGGLFFSGTCYGDCVGSIMSRTLFAKGFDAYCGATNTIGTMYADRLMASTSNYLTEKDSSGQYRTIDEALQLAKNKHGERCMYQTTIVAHNNPATEPFRLVPLPKNVTTEAYKNHSGFIVDVQQQTTVPDGYIGIYSFADFAKIAASNEGDNRISGNLQEINEINSAKYILMNDITCPADYDTGFVFAGTLDGNGYMINNVSKPLFYFAIHARFQNIGLELNVNGSYFESDDYNSFGGLFYSGGIGSQKHNYVENCFSTGRISITEKCGSIGGLVASNNNSVNISNCYNTANITVTGAGYVGGIVGSGAVNKNCYNTGNITVTEVGICGVGGITGNSYTDIKYCYNTGNISVCATSSGAGHVGGIIGESGGIAGDIAYISNCYNTGNISITTAYPADSAEYYEQFEDEIDGTFGKPFVAGGIAGGRNAICIEKCWNSGNIYGKNAAGGISGSCMNKITIRNCFNIGAISSEDYAGGLLGKMISETPIANSYNYGTVSAAKFKGALIGSANNPSSVLQGCYYLNLGLSATTSGASYSEACALSANQFSDLNNLSKLDHSLWFIDPAGGIPQLKELALADMQ